MVERKKEEASSCKDIIFDRKKLAQNSFEKLTMEVKELVRFVKSLQFSRDNLRSGNERIMGRLDIVYVFKCIKDGQECQVFLLHIERRWVQVRSSPNFMHVGNEIESNNTHFLENEHKTF
jgi:hypothetical protein